MYFAPFLQFGTENCLRAPQSCCLRLPEVVPNRLSAVGERKNGCLWHTACNALAHVVALKHGAFFLNTYG